MSLNYDFSKCERPKNRKEAAALDCLIWATMAVCLGEITEKNAAEFYARLAFCEKVSGGFRTMAGHPVCFKPEEVKRWIGLKTNVQNLTRLQFLKRYEHDLNRAARDYEEAVNE